MMIKNKKERQNVIFHETCKEKRDDATDRQTDREEGQNQCLYFESAIFSTSPKFKCLTKLCS